MFFYPRVAYADLLLLLKLALVFWLIPLVTTQWCHPKTLPVKSNSFHFIVQYISSVTYRDCQFTVVNQNRNFLELFAKSDTNSHYSAMPCLNFNCTSETNSLIYIVLYVYLLGYIFIMATAKNWSFRILAQTAMEWNWKLHNWNYLFIFVFDKLVAQSRMKQLFWGLDQFNGNIY